ncbi:hypothetical protein H0H81_010543 [Sphagnurus paluster]|uniref:tRNA (adenine(58)-N(1))-methyltransferase catalytic subunit TRM61 n=1 Tax=Sphagnurus paluster TaxID=117069 RepID=A0A9P7FYM2_9AGAR|nr:hypothetical protein H0H81_010543 [Sphagnurus paluster]
MWSTAREIAAGDLVIIWLTREALQPLLITPGKDFNSKFGHYRHADLVGVPYGSKVGSRKGKGFIHVLRPTPELWTLALPHRTQILYLADIAFITSHLNINRGSRVIEAGSTGHLWSYEFHEVRASKARQVVLRKRPPVICIPSIFREEFTRHGMNDTVTLTHKNVCRDGFTVIDTADSVFLDLPAPWEAVEHAKQALRKDRTTRICCFSPCMEQVLRTVNALNDAGFTDLTTTQIEITMYETLVRPIDVSHTPALTPVGEITEKLKLAERKREDKRLKQIAAGRQNISASKRKRDDGSPAQDQEQLEHLHTAEGATAAPAAGGSKRIRTSEEDHDDDTRAEPAVLEMDLDTDLFPPAPSGPSRIPISLEKISVSKVMSEVRGHTSYLTFASLQPFNHTAETESSTAAATPTPEAEL